ncbi:hypothetical protein U9M48_021117 [Paspalum notatum var. saurae]|uniref:Uncharacterized protein n=1 Tax=Paspalum notatum var. saurae TaxID=547442 RepID=A0AAQ3TIW6_PASNO
MPQHSHRASSTCCSVMAGSSCCCCCLAVAASPAAAFLSLASSRARSDMARCSPSIEILRGFACRRAAGFGAAAGAAVTTAASPLGAMRSIDDETRKIESKPLTRTIQSLVYIKINTKKKLELANENSILNRSELYIQSRAEYALLQLFREEKKCRLVEQMSVQNEIVKLTN